MAPQFGFSVKVATIDKRKPDFKKIRFHLRLSKTGNEMVKNRLYRLQICSKPGLARFKRSFGKVLVQFWQGSSAVLGRSQTGLEKVPNFQIGQIDTKSVQNRFSEGRKPVLRWTKIDFEKVQNRLDRLRRSKVQ